CALFTVSGCSDDPESSGGAADAGRIDAEHNDVRDNPNERRDATEYDVTSRGELELKLFENPSNVLSFYVSWSTEHEVGTVLDLDCHQGEYNAHFESEQARPDHEVL